MATTEDYLLSLQRDKQNIINSVKQKGVDVPENATFTDLVGKVDGIPVGNVTPETFFFTNNDTTNIKNAINAKNLIKEIPANLKMSSMNSFFRYCENVVKIGEQKTSNFTDFTSSFEQCKKLNEIPKIDTSNATTFRFAFKDCYSLKTIPLLECGNIKEIIDAFINADYIKNVGGFHDLGKAYSGMDTNSYGCQLRISDYYGNLTHDSIINIFNNLWDLKSSGFNPQKVIIGRKNLAKITPEEIKIATDKGWNVS